MSVPKHLLALSYPLTRVVLIPMPVWENAADTVKNAGIGVAEYSSLCTYQIPCNLLAIRNGTQLLSS